MPATLQQRYYLGLFEANPASVGENMPGAYELTGAEVDASALAAAVEGLVARHAALRTSFFKAADGTWMQRVAPPEQVRAVFWWASLWQPC